MKDFLIKIRHFKEASSKSSESPNGPPSAQSWCGGREEAWASGKARTKRAGSTRPPCPRQLLTQTPSHSPGREVLRFGVVASLPTHCSYCDCC